MIPNDDRAYFLHHIAPHLKEDIFVLTCRWNWKSYEAPTWAVDFFRVVNLRSLPVDLDYYSTVYVCFPGSEHMLPRQVVYVALAFYGMLVRSNSHIGEDKVRFLLRLQGTR